MTPTPPPFTRPLSALWPDTSGQPPRFDVLIVGSGYGGSAVAAGLAGCTLDDPALARARPARIAVLERGRHYRPGEFPSRFADLPRHMRMARQRDGVVVENRDALLDVRIGDDVMALVASGLGGGSLINAGVLLQPDLADFADPAMRDWHALLGKLDSAHYFRRALDELGGRVTRNGQPVDNTIDLHAETQANGPLAKTWALECLADPDKVLPQPPNKAARKVPKPPLSIAMAAGPNSAGVRLKACTLCGDCMTGCNTGAKDSLDVNLLHKAQRAGVEFYTGASVISIERAPGAEGWRLGVVHTDPRLQARERGVQWLRARYVVLSAGALGSTEILLRSRNAQLCFSSRLGEGFSCNGDNIAAVHRMPVVVQGVADEDIPADKRRVGPTISASFKLGKDSERRGARVQEFAVPAPLKRVFQEMVTTAHALHELAGCDRTPHGPAPRADDPDPLAVNDADIEHSLLVGLIGHDDARGALRLPRPLRPAEGPPATGTVTIHWPQARHAKPLNDAHDLLDAQVHKLNRCADARAPARLLANPLWRLLPPELEDLATQPRGPVLTVHPLGGCGIGATAETGVVDACGRVFNPAAAPGDPPWHDGLVVLDGAIVPGSLGVNPALTITALAMHAIDQLRVDWGLHGGTSFAQAAPAVASGPPRPSVPLPALKGVPRAALTTEVQIIERLRGVVPLHVGRTRPQLYIVELTLAFEPVAVRKLMSTLERKVDVDTNHLQTRLRVYDKALWEELGLRVRSDTDREPALRFEAGVSGHLRLLHRERSRASVRVARALHAYACNRGWRDLWQGLAAKGQRAWQAAKAKVERGGDRVRASYAQARKHGLGSLWQSARAAVRGGGDGSRDTAGSAPARPGRSICSAVRTLIALASHGGEVRRFDYELEIEKVLPNRFDRGLDLPLDGPAVISGCKRITYNRRANPWQQLTRLALTRMPGLQAIEPPVLELDTAFMAGIGVPLLRIERQRDQACALADLASFGLYMARVLLFTHLWTFRKPDAPGRDEPRRLPGVVAGMPPQITELVVDHVRGADHRRSNDFMRANDRLVKIRLSRYVPKQARKLPPLVMIHGYSVSGNTFTHESLCPSAAEHFVQRGRDVWVVELRTSAGLPTAREPWAFEHAALIDIPAALLHVKAVTGRRVDVFAHCIGCTMLGMAILSDAGEVRSGELQLGPDVWLTREQLGTLAAFNGTQRDGGEHPCVRRIVLSQKGPVLRYTDDNILRAYMLQSLRALLFDDDFQFRPGAEPTVQEELLDRLLASLPYPKADYDIENPLRPWAKTPWTTTRHRMDALYGRDFAAANLRRKTLAAIDDLFGPINLDTVAQTIHFARFCAITNQAGRGEFVTRGRLRKRWGGIPTLAIHGEDNGLADFDTQRLLCVHLQGAGVPFKAVPYPGMGHQDVLIGRGAKQVFRDVEDFLADPPPPSKPDRVRPHACTEPWIGPRIDLPRWPQRALRLATMSPPQQGEARLCLLPALRVREGNRVRHVPLYGSGAACVGDRGHSGKWLFAQPDLAALQAAPIVLRGRRGWFAVLVYDADEIMAFGRIAWPQPQREQKAGGAAGGSQRAPARRAADLPPSDPSGTLFGAPGAGAGDGGAAALAPPAAASRPMPLAGSDGARIAEADDWLRRMSEEVRARCFVALDDLLRIERGRAAAAAVTPFAFTVASCQYPKGLLDAGIAGASLGTLAKRLGATDLALFVGDQIYSDATAGLLDATRRDERYDQPYDSALRLPELRQVMRRVPTLMLLDDHEMVDNWEPFAPAVADRWPQAKRERDRARTLGLASFFKYQRMHQPHGSPPADQLLCHGGYPFYLLDTRSRRSARGSTVAAGTESILDAAQWARLERWLLAHGNAVKFVATPSLLLPRRRASAEHASASAYSDTWDGFPASLHRLLAFIAEHSVRNTVFVSGDEHHAVLAECWLQPNNVKLLSVHTAALHAPFPFANGRPARLRQIDDFSVSGRFSAHVRARFVAPGDGFARLRVLPARAGSAPSLNVTFACAGGGGTNFVVALA
jgi:cholesterol oxidase